MNTIKDVLKGRANIREHISWKWSREIFLLILVLLMPVTHELGHWIGYTIDGVPATFNYGFTWSQETTLIGVMGGPVVNILLGVVCLVIAYKIRYKMIWGAIGLVAIISRLVNVGIIFLLGSIVNPDILLGNDEGKIALLIGAGVQPIYIVSLAIYVLLTLGFMKAFNDNKIYIRLYGKLFTYNIILTLALIIFQFV